MDGKVEIVYDGVTPDGLKILADGETVWLTQAQMCLLFGRERSVITKHVRNAIREGEISEKSNVQNLHVANSDKPVKFYDLDVVISVGYRVKSLQGTLFRRWATRVLREMLLRRLEETKSIANLERRMTKVENDVERIKEGMGYLVEQLSAPPAVPRRRIGFDSRENAAPSKPYGKRRG